MRNLVGSHQKKEHKNKCRVYRLLFYLWYLFGLFQFLDRLDHLPGGGDRKFFLSGIGIRFPQILENSDRFAGGGSGWRSNGLYTPSSPSG